MKFFLTIVFSLFVSLFASSGLFAAGLTELVPREESQPHIEITEVMVNSILVSQNGTGTITVNSDCDDCVPVLMAITKATIFYSAQGGTLKNTGLLTGKWIELEYDVDKKNVISIKEIAINNES